MPSLGLLSRNSATWLGPADWLHRRAAQQPQWPDPAELLAVTEYLSELPALTTPQEITHLHSQLVKVQAGEAFLLQGGDCAELLGTDAVQGASGKQRLLAEMADRIRTGLGLDVVTVGRLAGQFAKPRSEPTEVVDGVTLPVFRGLMVNGPEPVASERQPDPYRLLSCYYTAKHVLQELRGRLWTSHEALILEYERAFRRLDAASGEHYLLSTHLPWIGERTRQIGGAHVAFLAAVANPLQVKVGPNATPDDIVELCEILDPQRIPGRLTLISRMGAAAVSERLPTIVAAIHDRGHSVIWICDPMHGNTVKTANGRKTRYLSTVHDELAAFFTVMATQRQHAGGVHLEMTCGEVTECVGGIGVSTEADLEQNFESLCDPRLNEEQALSTADLIAKSADRPVPIQTRGN
ncbi:phospho-2-dehydro-3-deoxyheptonate aldolase [Rhizocola hellebori]|uniref:Phospho-2-dehydro-3-deoxyheptonate aldolase n=1 Tax=Rhizocola hellebori TaxID=1392758 RepID=A0A8J3Q866_9ACTN|nr:3-deoxy-7-phosphoheptulonate synthase [Rhizocola hellebori]GIH05147.1 phospho-2-dehydro-3-deoxyheptonate aldolase [Rhizocola hellebori]